MTKAPDPDHCAVCARHIGKTATRYLIHRQHVACTTCVFNDRSPHRTKHLHSLVAPNCETAWHDHWDHSGDVIAGTRTATASALREQQAATR